MVCKEWRETFQHPQLWQTFKFWFFLPHHERALHGVKEFGKFMKNVTIGVNQNIKSNRQNACALLEYFSKLDKRRLTSLEIIFTGENPLFYSGQEFLDTLSVLLNSPPDTVSQPWPSLQRVNLSGLSIPYDDHVIDILSLNNKGLRFIDIQNKVLVCKVTPPCILRLVQRCQNLRDLRLFHCSMSDDILEALADDKRTCLEHLSIVSRREEKYGGDLTSEAWQKLANKCPDLRVTLGFDHTCPFNLIPVIMKPEIPVKTLKLETFAMCHEEVNLAASYYSNTLEKLVLQTRNSLELEQALLSIARRCSLLRALLVYCVVSRETIEEIFRLHPDMETRGTFILKSEVEPEPWVVGVEEGD